MKIGIGVISYKRPNECLDVCQGVLRTIDNLTNKYSFVCAVDQDDVSEYKEVAKVFPIVNGKNAGVAMNKNRALHYLRGCDVVFLLEDDFKPIHTGWVELYLNAIKETGMQHFNHIRLDHRDKLYKIIRMPSFTMGIYQRNTAQLMVMTKQVIDKIGAFDTRYGKFGFEHSDYTRRCKLTGLCAPANHDAHPFIIESDIYFEDMGIAPCFSAEERKKYSEEANRIYMQFDPNRIYLPFPKELQ
jgi:glycosyltransferase involved in cell wall biosynthesis